MKPLCENCSVPFRRRHARQRWCPDCLVVDVDCAFCGEAMTTPRRYMFRYCSSECRGKGSAGPGRDHPRYKGGLHFNARKNRWYINCRDGREIPYARGVMAAEVGRLLRPDEIVHHVNGDSCDDCPENLEITTRSEHMRTHMPDLLAARGVSTRDWEDLAA